VEDNKTIRLENESALLRAGYEVICAEAGESALRRAQTLKPELILLDLILPKMSGTAVLARLKADPGTAHIPVVVLSSLSRKNREKLIEAGAEDYFEKSWLMPVGSMNRLPQVLENVIGRIQRRQKAAARGVLVAATSGQ
jgi:CheY-like chemotaxis protein